MSRYYPLSLGEWSTPRLRVKSPLAQCSMSHNHPTLMSEENTNRSSLAVKHGGDENESKVASVGALNYASLEAESILYVHGLRATITTRLAILSDLELSLKSSPIPATSTFGALIKRMLRGILHKAVPNPANITHRYLTYARYTLHMPAKHTDCIGCLLGSRLQHVRKDRPP